MFSYSLHGVGYVICFVSIVLSEFISGALMILLIGLLSSTCFTFCNACNGNDQHCRNISSVHVTLHQNASNSLQLYYLVSMHVAFCFFLSGPEVGYTSTL
jgi:hypothetical protein